MEREDIRVMGIATSDELDEIHSVWRRLEEIVPLRGRKFFAAVDIAVSDYFACVQMNEDDNPAALGLVERLLPGGRYLRARLRGEPPGLYDQIGPAFESLAKDADHDATRPSIEFYRRRDEVDVLLPVA